MAAHPLDSPRHDALTAAAAAAERYAAASRAASTRRAYAADWRHFTQWCAQHGVSPLPAAPRTVALYLAAHAVDLRPATLGRRLAALAAAHRAAGQPFDRCDPRLAEVWSGIRRVHGIAPVAPKAALTPAVLDAIVATFGDHPRDRRDRALLLLGFAAALRRSELVALDLRDLQWSAEGLLVTVRRGKTDQVGAGQVRPVARQSGAPLCPVAAVAAWLRAARCDSGPLFRPVRADGTICDRRICPRTVARAVQRGVARLADSAITAPAVGGHSLRIGYVTAALHAGVPLSDIMRQTGHKDVGTLLRYARPLGAAAVPGLSQI